MRNFHRGSVTSTVSSVEGRHPGSCNESIVSSVEVSRNLDGIASIHEPRLEAVLSGPPPVTPSRLARCASTFRASSALRVASLNLGGRNTNPLEFELKGDSSTRAERITAILKKAGKVLRRAEDGPLSMLPAERTLIQDILREVYSTSEDFEGRARIQELLNRETWMRVIARVQEENPHLFNALNLSTLKLRRPSVWEDPASCKTFADTKEYLLAWRQWYNGLDPKSRFWLDDAPRAARKRGLDVATAFAGLLIFDVMCLCTARDAMSSGSKDTPSPNKNAAFEETRAVPFKELAEFAAQLPASSLTARHEIATAFISGAHAVLAQEARNFADHPVVALEFLPPFAALDGFTCVLLRRNSFHEATNISEAVAKTMHDRMDSEAGEYSAKTWRTNCNRLAAVYCRCSPQVGGFRVCFVSLHCSKSEYTPAFVETLRDVLAEYNADINIVGMDSNCGSREVPTFKDRLTNAGVEIGCLPRKDQVTVAKQRTCFQTQTQKIGETDIAHKDYIVSWTSARVRRGETSYTPDLRTAYGVEQVTEQCVRLPTTKWPFDHCGVVTTFRSRCSCQELALFTPRVCLLCILAGIFVLAVAAFVVSPERDSVYGPPGTWFYENWIGTPRYGICEAEARPSCPRSWIKEGGSCYMVTPKMGYTDMELLCNSADSHPVSITSEAENNYVTWLCPRGELCWIGLQSDYSRGRKWWVSGEAVEYNRVVERHETYFPIIPISRATDYEVAIVSNMPPETTGCSPELFVPFQKLDPLLSMLMILVTPALALLVSAVVFLLPRPRRPLTTLYLVSAITVNVGALIPKLGTACFVANFRIYKLMYEAGRILDAGGHTMTSLLLLWLIIRRLNMIYPARALKVVFIMLVVCIVSSMSLATVFVDTTASARPNSFPLLVMQALYVIIAVLYACAASLLAADMYNGWQMASKEVFTPMVLLRVLTTKVHFIIIMAAILTGALRWCASLAVLAGWTQTTYPAWATYVFLAFTTLDSITNDLCAHFLAIMDLDGIIIRASGITHKIAENAKREVQSHRLAVRMLQAAPTSADQEKVFAKLENKARDALAKTTDQSAFVNLQAAAQVESSRIQRLMQCVRIRTMSMPIRYQFIMEVPILDSRPRQHVPERFSNFKFVGGNPASASSEYFSWLYAEADKAQELLFSQMKQLIATFNCTPWPSDLGLARKQFPWTIWSGGPEGVSVRQLNKGDVISPGDVLIHRPRKTFSGGTYCFVVDETSKGVIIHRNGAELPQEVPREQLRTCSGGGVFVPGRKKKKSKCQEKIKHFFEGHVPWPPAASLVDICRCMIVLDDPYAIAVLVTFICNNFRVVCIKNRFREDTLEPVSPEALQCMFYSSKKHVETKASAGFASSSDRQFRDVLINVEMITPSGTPFVCEIQVTLSNLAILKQADHRLTTLRRMKDAEELNRTYVFNTPKAREEG